MHDDLTMLDIDLIGAAEAAEILRVDQSTVTRRAKAGTLPSIKKANGLRGPWMFERSIIEAEREKAS